MENVRNDKLQKYPNDDYSRFASKDYVEHNDTFDEANYYESRQTGMGGIDTDSDQTIGEKACQVLMRHPTIDASDIYISVHETGLTLNGVVSDFHSKQEAEKCLRQIPEVTTIINALQVRS